MGTVASSWFRFGLNPMHVSSSYFVLPFMILTGSIFALWEVAEIVGIHGEELLEREPFFFNAPGLRACGFFSGWLFLWFFVHDTYLLIKRISCFSHTKAYINLNVIFWTPKML